VIFCLHAVYTKLPVSCSVAEPPKFEYNEPRVYSAYSHCSKIIYAMAPRLRMSRNCDGRISSFGLLSDYVNRVR
jgi:hypothetical protein